MQAPDAINDVARAIQLALAPVFLLTGIAGMLGVMTGRLSRIIDRGRALSAGKDVPTELSSVQIELQSLERRRHCVSVAITSCTVAALLVCMVIATLFLDVALDAPLEGFISPLFTAAMLALVVGLAYFLREVQMATWTTRIQGTRRE
jgi:hypothetical protein